jgi:hypothetical protein
MRALHCLAALVLLAAPVSGASAQLVSEAEAARVAARWVDSVVESRGSWGGAEHPSVGDPVALRYGGRTVGHLFPVEPGGFVAVSLRREFAPVKAYSEDSKLDPAADDGPSDLLRGQMARIIERAEALTGQPIESVEPEDLASVLEIDYRESWALLEREALAFPAVGGPRTRGNYEEGEILVHTSWDQEPPYNAACPDSGCFYSSFPGYNTNALVGCVATAGAQIMRYWCWPPGGVGSPYSDPYDWPNMFEDCFYSITSYCFMDSDGPPWVCLTQAQVDAVAELCAEVGQAVGMDYGCDASSAHTEDMEGVYEDHYRYSTACGRVDRPDYTAEEWFTIIKAQCNMNRPLQYRILGHSIVCDGWQEPGGIPQYHMNYGGGGGAYNTWYTLDALYYPYGGSTDDEFLLRSIYPINSFVGSFSGSYAVPAYPYRYFTTDSQGSSATFAAGHSLQTLPGLVIECGSGYVKVLGSSSSASRLFARGQTSRGMKVTGGAMKLLPGGEVTIP